MKIVILAAGKGSRLGDQQVPKPLTLLHNGMSILQYQLHQLSRFFTADDIFIVVGHRKEMIMESFPDPSFIFSPNFAIENTSKSLLRALKKLKDDVLWLNGDVVFHPSVLHKVVSSPRSVMLVNQGPVGDEEVKYRTDDFGRIVAVGKQLSQPEGEALGINLIKADGLETLRQHLERCQDGDYFEKAIETAIAAGLNIWALPVDREECTEIDFPEDLERANVLIAKWKNGMEPHDNLHTDAET